MLILGGTAEAVALAHALARTERLAPVTSLAGRTRAPRLPPGEVRVGGFGGAEGLADWLRGGGIAGLVDATHPFAVRIKASAVVAARELGIPLLRVERAPWAPVEGDRWHRVGTWPEAMDVVPRLGRIALAAVGRQDAERLDASVPVAWIVRSIERPAMLPEGARWVPARPPFRADEERALLQRYDVDLVLCKNSGGEGARAKLDAARELALPVVMVQRPPVPPAPTVRTVEEAVVHLLGLAGRSTWL